MASPNEQSGREALRLNLLILLGYRNAVSVDTAMSIGEMIAIAGDPEQTDGTAYSEQEVREAISALLSEEFARLVKSDFDASQLTEYATGIHPDHRLYITAIGVLHVKRYTDAAERDAESGSPSRDS